MLNISQRRQDIAVTLITALVLGFLVNVLASVVFGSLWDKHGRLIGIVSAVGVLLVSLFLYFYILVRGDQRVKRSEYVCVFRRAIPEFVDLPGTPASVLTRVYFNELPAEERTRLASFDHHPEFWTSPFLQFHEECVQAVLLSLVFGYEHGLATGWHHYPLSGLPAGIAHNDILKRHDQRLAFKMCVPPGARVETYGRNNRFIRVTSDHAIIELSWTIAFSMTAYESASYLETRGFDPEDAHEFRIEVEMQVRRSYRHIFKDEFAVYEGWVQERERKFSRIDLTEFRRRLPIEMLQELIRRGDSGGNS